jgi:hypothetical protein
VETGVCSEGSSLVWLSSSGHDQSLIGLDSSEGSSLAWISSSGRGQSLTRLGSLEGSSSASFGHGQSLTRLGRVSSRQMSPFNSWSLNWSLRTGVRGDGELCSPTADTSTLLAAAALWVWTPRAKSPSHVEFNCLECLCLGLMAALPFVLLAEPPLWLLRPVHWNWRYKLKQQACTNYIAIQTVKHCSATYTPSKLNTR